MRERSMRLEACLLFVMACGAGGPAQSPPAGKNLARVTIAQVFGGRVTSTPAGIDCQSDPPNSSRTKGVCAAAFDEGATVTLAWTWTMAAGPAQFHVTGPGGATDECAGTSDHCTLRLVGGDYAVSVDAVTIPPFPAQ